MSLHPGLSIGRYTLVEPLGEGAQGSVWKVVDPQNAAVRALKLIDLAQLPHSAASRAKLEVEAVMKAADHPAIAPCYDVFTPPQGGLGLVFELVRGQPLADLLTDARMGADHRAALLEQLASALAHIHARGIVHRDLKPENVLVTDAFWRDPRGLGNVKLVDFGVASAMSGGTGLTAVGGFVGTIPYLSPEVLSPGRWPLTPTGYPRDVFAFGVLGWELCMGRHPTGLPLDAPPRAFAEVYDGAATGRLPWPPQGLDEPMGAVLATCLAIDPRGRFPDGTCIHRALGSLPARDSARRRAGPTRRHVDPTTEGAAVDPFAATSTAVPSTRDHIPSSRDAVVPLTTPMPVPTAPDAPSPSGEKARPRSPWWAAVALLTLGLSVAVVVGYVVAGADDNARPTARPPESRSPSRAVPPTPQPEPSPPLPPPCCADNGLCKSGRVCTPSPCTPTYIPERWLRLRLTGAASGLFPAFPHDLAGKHPSADVCLRRASPSGDWVCAPMRKVSASNDGDRDDRLWVLTSDLEAGNIDIMIRDKGVTLAEGRSAPNPRGLSNSMLCIGFRLYVGPREGATYYVHGYLDDE